MVILPKDTVTRYIHAEWWRPENPDERSYGRLGIYRHPTGEVARLELVTDPTFTGALVTRLDRFMGPGGAAGTVLWGRELGTDKAVTLLAIEHSVDTSVATILVTGHHACGLSDFELSGMTASSDCLHKWSADSYWESFDAVNTPDTQTLMVEVPRKALWEPSGSEGEPSLELRVVPSVGHTPTGITLGLTTQAMFTGELTAAAGLKAIRELSIFISLCLGERFEFEKVFSGRTAEGQPVTIVVAGEPLPKPPYFHYAPVSLTVLQQNPSSFIRFKALCTSNIELVTELYSRLLSAQVVGETDVLRQVAMTEGLARLVFGENGKPGLVANKAQLEIWKRKHSATSGKGYSETGITIRRAVDHLPPLLLAIAQKALHCSEVEGPSWADRFERLVQHRHTAGHFLHSLPVGYAPTGDEFFSDWHASKTLAYLLCMALVGFPESVYDRVATLEAWRRPRRASSVPVTL